MSPVQICRSCARPDAFRLETTQWLDAGIDEVFDYFSEAGNLEELTPAWMQFRIVTPQPIVMQVGRRIDYRLKIHGIPLKWQSEITVWDPPHRFVDEQRAGPYRLWHHEHHFESENGGTRVGDHVDYAVPGGRILHWLLVERDLRKIFEYRAAKLQQVFAADPSLAFDDAAH